MKRIKLKTVGRVTYPIASHIKESLPIVREMASAIEQLCKKECPDCSIVLWCRGSSGAIISGVIASLIDIQKICHVKKNGEKCHDYGAIDTFYKPCVHIIVDDFISTGETVNAIMRRMKECDVKKLFAICLGDIDNTDPSNFILKPKFLISK